MNEPTQIFDSYEAYGCQINAISIDTLFDRYKKAGFVYPAKFKELAPYWDEIKNSWKSAVRAGELIHWFATCQEGEDWGTISSWRSCNTGWITQHLVTSGSPLASRAVMLGGQAIRIRDQFDRSHQNWFQPSKRLPMRIFGSLVDTIGSQYAGVDTFQYVGLPRCNSDSSDASIRVVPWTTNLNREFCAFALSIRGLAYVTAEELDCEDGLLEGVDELYCKVGLRRYRRMWLAYDSVQEGPIACLIAYRGPLGFNFSFLENRCDLLVKPDISEGLATDAIKSLVVATWPTYDDFPPMQLYITCDYRSRFILEGLGGSFIREYAQSIWLQEGYLGWYRHVEKFYERVKRAEHRRGLSAAKSRKQDQ